MIKIKDIRPDSIAADLGLKKGDMIKSINGRSISDYIDFRYETSENFFTLGVDRLDGEYWELEIERGLNEELGIVPEGIIFDSLKICNNNCIFCFVKQQPPGLRNTLNLKDDDYRFSFLQGSFITLTNLNDEELNRIISQNLSPLNISVHTTNPELREKMMKNPGAAQIMEQLDKLARGGIDFNTQIVLCPGLNDGRELDRTINDLLSLFPNLLSLGIVPVGLTGYRDGLYHLKSYGRTEASRFLKQLEGWQDKCRLMFDKNFIYASDEFYFLAEEEIPAYEEYNGFPQIENGIGLTRLLWSDFENLRQQLPEKTTEKEFATITGQLGKLALEPIIKRLNQITGLRINLIPINNHFFGQTVTVTGLLTGSDIIKGLARKKDLPGNLILPGIIINDQEKLLDDMTLSDIEKEFPEKRFFLADNLNGMLEVIFDGKAGGSNSRQT